MPLHFIGASPIWLNDVLERMVSGEVKINNLDQLLPWNWQPSGDPAMRLAA